MATPPAIALPLYSRIALPSLSLLPLSSLGSVHRAEGRVFEAFAGILVLDSSRPVDIPHVTGEDGLSTVVQHSPWSPALLAA
ncbi:hypothetical protein [Kitasatospora sp. NPDC096204]|uniref:hypothetical protein n=1 Tax=Kitasatospora sp. NPDC096204 TaxID=3364094 RepID=UPI003801151A